MRIWREGVCAALAAAALASPSSGQTPAKRDLGKIAADILHQKSPGDVTQLSKGDVVSGLKEALSVGSELAGRRLSAKDGFFGDSNVRIALPGVLGEAQRRLAPFGMAGPLDDLQLKVNRAAEAATPTARRLVVETVRSMTFEDAMGVLRGGDTAATDFLRKRSEADLRKALRPYFDSALKSSGALGAIDALVAKYGAGLVKQDAKTWLAESATTGALNGLFYYLAREEQAIRRDPVKRASDILRKVFGG